MNNRAQLAAIARIARERIAEDWMLAGVTLEDPASTFIDADVSLEADVTLGAGVHLRGRTRIQTGVRIDVGSVVTDAVLSSGVTVKPYSVITDADVGSRAQVGPFSHLRPGSELGVDARVGNFVETKKTRLGAGAKANHLAYLGDADVGARANVGAGTITCNYDGTRKHRTVIGESAFIGSDTQLVAPVTVGKGAYVGAGTTVTEDVPPDALALTRSKQTNIEGYASRKKKD